MDQFPTLNEFKNAAKKISHVVVRTSLVPLHGDDSENIWLKLEIHQNICAFKIRGFFHAVSSLKAKDRKNGISTVSAGNSALALAWAGRYFGVEARSLMPNNAPSIKVESMKKLGGIPVMVTTKKLFQFLKEKEWEKEPYCFIHPWINRDVMIGHGSIGLEIYEDLADVDTVFIPVGGGGLISGVGAALKRSNPSIKIIGVEPKGCAALHASFENGKAVSVKCETMCDGVAVPYMTDEMYPLLCKIVDEVVLVTEKEVKSTIKRLAMKDKIIVEGSAALSVAAALNTPLKNRGKCVCIVTGGNIDSDKLIPILSSSQ